MPYRRLLTIWLLTLGAAASQALAEKLPSATAALETSQTAAETRNTSEFIRFHEDDAGAQLQTGLGVYQNAKGVKVTLIGAVHIADLAYYEALNERFKAYDALLYEMVGGPIKKRTLRSSPPLTSEKGKPGHGMGIGGDAIEVTSPAEEEAVDLDEIQREAEAGKRLSFLHTLFTTMQRTLALAGQMDGIDYHASNFVHADMSLVQFAEMQQEKKEGFLSLWLKAVKVQMESPQVTANQPGLLTILEILCRKDSATELKRLVGRQFDSVEALMAGMEADDGTVIISERNKVALAVMEREIAAGKKNLAIFYGAAHLTDMEQRLLSRGFKRIHHEWLTAWDLPPPAPSTTTPGQPASMPPVAPVPVTVPDVNPNP